MLFTKVRKVKSPCRAYMYDAGIDFFVPDDEMKVIVLPHDRVCIPSGIKVQVPFGYALIAFNKSGFSSKTGMSKLAEVIDYGYQGEVHLSFINTSNKPVTICPGQKIAQFVLVSVGIHTPLEVFSADYMHTNKGDRGNHGFGSTGGK